MVLVPFFQWLSYRWNNVAFYTCITIILSINQDQCHEFNMSLLQIHRYSMPLWFRGIWVRRNNEITDVIGDSFLDFAFSLRETQRHQFCFDPSDFFGNRQRCRLSIRLARHFNPVLRPWRCSIAVVHHSSQPHPLDSTHRHRSYIACLYRAQSRCHFCYPPFPRQPVMLRC